MKGNFSLRILLKIFFYVWLTYEFQKVLINLSLIARIIFINFLNTSSKYKTSFRNHCHLVLFKRFNLLLPCKQDCNFDRLLSVESNFTADLTYFATNALNNLPSTVSCRNSKLSKYLTPPKTASEIVSNLSELQIKSWNIDRKNINGKITFILRSN